MGLIQSFLFRFWQPILAVILAIWLVRRLRRWLRQREQSLPAGRSGSVRRVTHHENGRMKTERHVLDGAMHGSWMVWDEEGNKTSEGEYYKGMMHGQEIHYTADGQKIRETSWVEGRRHGTQTEFDVTGEVVKQLCYVHADEDDPASRGGACSEDDLATPKPD